MGYFGRITGRSIQLLLMPWFLPRQYLNYHRDASFAKWWMFKYTLCSLTTIQHVKGKIWRCISVVAWWRHQMETFSALLAICAGNSPVTGEFPVQRQVTRIFDVFFDLRLNKRFSKQTRGWWLETILCPLWRHCNGITRGLQSDTKHNTHRSIPHWGRDKVAAIFQTTF